MIEFYIDIAAFVLAITGFLCARASNSYNLAALNAALAGSFSVWMLHDFIAAIK